MPSIGNIKAEVLVRVQGSAQPIVVGHIQIPVHVSVGAAVAGKVEAEIGPEFSGMRSDLADAISDAISTMRPDLGTTRINRKNKEN